MKMGFEGLIYYGVKGTTASTLITNRVDVTCDTDPQMAPTTVCGTGSAPPIESEDVCTVKFSATLKMKNVGSTDTVLAALRTAAATGGQVAIRMIDYTAQKGFDGDVNVKESQGLPIGGEQTFDFTFTPNNKSRAPQLYV